MLAIPANFVTGDNYTITAGDVDNWLTTLSLIRATLQGKVIVPSNVKIIGTSAFENCSNLVSVDLPQEIVSIGLKAFKDCQKLNNVNFAELINLESIGQGSFNNAGLSSIIIPGNVTAVEKCCFYCRELQLLL